MGEMQIIYKGINELIPYDKNPRKNDEGVDKVVEEVVNAQRGEKSPYKKDNSPSFLGLRIETG